MIRFLYITGLSFFFLMATRGTAQAYIDPGVGGMFYQVIIVIIGAVAAYFAGMKTVIRGLFRKRKSPESEGEDQ